MIGRDSFCLDSPAEGRVSRYLQSDASRCSEQEYFRSTCQCLGSMAPLCAAKSPSDREAEERLKTGIAQALKG